jgi:hypothetical protein
VIRYLISADAAERVGAAEEFVRGLPPGVEAVLVGHTRGAIDDLARQVARARRATFGLHRFTLGQFAARTAGAVLASRGVSPSTPLGADALAARAVFEERRRAPLDYLEPVASCPGFPRALASTLHEIREAGIDGGRIAELPAPGPDLARLLDEHARQVADAGVADRAAPNRCPACEPRSPSRRTARLSRLRREYVARLRHTHGLPQAPRRSARPRADFPPARPRRRDTS